MGLTKTLVSECGAQSVITIYKNCYKIATIISGLVLVSFMVDFRIMLTLSEQ